MVTKVVQRLITVRNWRLKSVYIVLGAVILCVIVVLVSLITWYRHALKPVSSSAQTIQVEVARGETATQVADELKTKELIRSSMAFRLFYREHHGAAHIQAGKYALSPNMTPSQIIQVLTHGKVVSDAISVTIPEGYNVADIASRLEQAGVCSKSAFLNAEEHGQFKQSFLANLSGRKGIRYRLEGFLFPDTYDFQPNESPTDVINVMLDDFQTRVLTTSLTSQLAAKHMSLNHLITEASLVENEAEVDSERPIIASVINNRLKVGSKLQVDATVEYALGHHVSVVTDAETQGTKSPYNTYLVKGLPPGPIDSPGLKSIDAVLHPATTDYFYYVAKGDGSGEHYFSKTYTEQLHNEALRVQNLRKAKK
ncbi:endolytic transglycosylase MltG [Alicyclobacillus dauci]|uniref:Endolytic murein transglycosylase n=1 Tax=Alicyclobacillus dauci TaxID=1475485 RepID=A0ABY6Z6I8_9BACL|nr:endolytic transglycosylase MltG [Alicyclobacillus dauci]WAH38509.1 endolytic transglycosylase MltG [Alicyclobacillus dauci]